jgi:hypothetical protein
MKLPVPFLAALMALCASAGQADAQLADKAESTIDVRIGASAAEAHMANRNFLFDSRRMEGGTTPVRLVLRLDTEITRREDTEGILSGRVSATAWRIDSQGKRKTLWSVDEPGDAGEISSRQPLFIVRQSGCCGSRDSFSVFNLYNGQRLFTATGDGPETCWAQLDVPNSGGLVRLVALHAAYSGTDAAAFGQRVETVGLLTYGSPDKPLARYRLLAESAAAIADFMGDATVRLVQIGKPEETDSLTLWPADGKRDPSAVGGFAIRLHLTEDKTVEIPVAGDRLDLAAATLPNGLKIEPVPLP